MTPTPCEQIAESMGALFECSYVNGYTRIRTPYLYPDGDVIDLFYIESGSVPFLTDLGETLGWLRTQTVSDRKTTRQRQYVEDICLTHGVELYKGMLTARVRSEEGLADAVARLSQAALRVADLWLTFRGRTTASINDEIEDFLAGREVEFDRREKLPGRSGRIWTVDFHTRVPDTSSLLYVLSTGSRATARSMVEHVATAWYDLSNYKLGAEPLQFVSLFDDELDVWTPDEFELLGELSAVTYWSQKDELTEVLLGQ